jgi:hypothetical protein
MLLMIECPARKNILAKALPRIAPLQLAALH